jgi:hypothetical protein
MAVRDEKIETKVAEAELMDGDGSVHFEITHHANTWQVEASDAVSVFNYIQLKGCVNHYGMGINYELPRLPRSAVRWLIEALTQAEARMEGTSNPDGAFSSQFSVVGSTMYPPRLKTWAERVGSSGNGQSQMESVSEDDDG